MKELALSICVGLAIVACLLPETEIEQPEGVLASYEPRQSPTESSPWERNSYRFKPLASYTIRGRVLLTARYWMGREADVSPLDLTLGWGPMSANSVLRQFKISRGHRCFYWRSKTDALPIPAEQVIRHTANLHLIPADDALRTQLKALHPGSLVEMGGFLVVATGSDGWTWRSSLSRDDSGPGACEVMWVEWMRAG